MLSEFDVAVVRRFDIRCAQYFLPILICALPVVGSASSESDYLQNLEAESARINSSATPPEKNNLQPEMRSQRSTFEYLMQEEYRGTYAFYKRLTEPSRKEVFTRYAGGAEMREIRKMVHERYRQHR